MRVPTSFGFGLSASGLRPGSGDKAVRSRRREAADAAGTGTIRTWPEGDVVGKCSRDRKKDEVEVRVLKENEKAVPSSTVKTMLEGDWEAKEGWKGSASIAAIQQRRSSR